MSSCIRNNLFLDPGTVCSMVVADRRLSGALGRQNNHQRRQWLELFFGVCEGNLANAVVLGLVSRAGMSMMCRRPLNFRVTDQQG